MLQNLDIAAGAGRGALTCCAGARACPTRWRGAGDDRPDRPRDGPAGVARARPEAVAGDRHAAGPGRPAAAARRAGRRHEPRGARGHRRAAAADRRERTVVVVEHDMDFLRAFAAVRDRAARGQGPQRGHGREVQADPRVQEVYLGPGHHAEDEVAAVLGGGCVMLQMRDVDVGYGRTSVLHGVTVEVPAGRGRRGDGPQRRGQDARCCGPRSGCCRSRRGGPARRRGRHRLRPARAGAARAGLRAAGPAVRSRS